jgi:two-component system, NarL family, sensor histidine kinase UhpB
VSLRLRLIISIGLGLLASLAFGGTFAFWEAARQVQTEMRSAIAVAEHIVQTAVNDSNGGAGRRERQEHLIREFDGNRHLQATLIDRKNQVDLASKLESTDTSVPEWFHHMLDRGPEIARIKLPPELDEYEAVVLTTDAANELAEKWGDIGLALAVLVIFCTFILGLMYSTLAKGLRPLRALNVAFACVGQGDYSPGVAESGASELAGLAREFNQMVRRLSTMKLQNARLNEQLANARKKTVPNSPANYTMRSVRSCSPWVWTSPRYIRLSAQMTIFRVSLHHALRQFAERSPICKRISKSSLDV